MAAATVPAVYASALLELADERSKRPAVVEDCATLAEALADEAAFRALLAPSLSRVQAKGLLDACFKGRVEQETLDLLKLLIDRGRFDEVRSILAEVEAISAADAGRVPVTVTSAVELPQTQRMAVQAALAKRLGDAVQPDYQVDPALRGGLVLSVGDRVIDTSVSRHLATMKQMIIDIPVSTSELWAEEGASS
ncbi:MAG: ATP synthase F1 subunit delta [Planctomycetota bacterium]|jgi:F-type H+-transporting ATPase subunit delta